MMCTDSHEHSQNELARLDDRKDQIDLYASSKQMRGQNSSHSTELFRQLPIRKPGKRSRDYINN